MSTPDDARGDDTLRIMVIDRQGRMTGVVELDDVLALCAGALSDRARRTAASSGRRAPGPSAGPQPGN